MLYECFSGVVCARKSSTQFILDVLEDNNYLVPNQKALLPHDYFPAKTGNYLFLSVPITFIGFDLFSNTHTAFYKTWYNFILVFWNTPIVLKQLFASNDTRIFFKFWQIMWYPTGTNIFKSKSSCNILHMLMQLMPNVTSILQYVWRFCIISFYTFMRFVGQRTTPMIKFIIPAFKGRRFIAKCTPSCLDYPLLES